MHAAGAHGGMDQASDGWDVIDVIAEFRCLMLETLGPVVKHLVGCGTR